MKIAKHTIQKLLHKKYTVILYALFFFIMVMTLYNKKNYHVDELLSYQLSNGTSVMFKDGITYVPSNTPWINCLTVNPDMRFNYLNVWKNQKNDTHPPLYYLILHLICSFFPKSFSIWYAGIINIVFALLTLWAVRKLIVSLTKNHLVCNTVSIMFIFSCGILSAVSFLRMYIMAMFWITLLTYLFIREVGRDSSAKFYSLIFATTVLGALTHYYCIVYTVLISFIYGVYLVFQKKRKQVVVFCSTMVLAASISFAIFPPMIYHMFFGGRGTESINNLTISSVSVYWDRLKQFFNIVSSQLFGNTLEYLLISMFFVSILKIMNPKRNERATKANVVLPPSLHTPAEWNLSIQYILIFLPTVIYFLFVSKSATYITDRYMFPVYAVAFTGILTLIFTFLLKIWNSNNFIWIGLIAAIILINSWKNIGWPYLFQSSNTLLEISANYGNSDCLYVYNDNWKTIPSFLEVSNYNSVTFIRNNDIDLSPVANLAACETLILIVNDDDENIINQVLNQYPFLSQYQSIGGYSTGRTYLLYSD